jgi:hypothetical protein
VPVETASIEDVGLGSRSFYIRNAPVVEGVNIGGADGILGLDSLQDQRVLLDFVNEQIAIADAEDLGGNRGYEIVVKARRRLGQLIITRRGSTESGSTWWSTAARRAASAIPRCSGASATAAHRRDRADRHQRAVMSGAVKVAEGSRSAARSCRTSRSCSRIRRRSTRSTCPTSRL